MPFYTYILFSKSLNKFYIGSTSLSPVERLEQHNQIKFPDAFTRKGIPWEMFLVIECNFYPG
ncbi:MAG: GIY-YIG nuclease family protein [Bacteroidetes bacterium]|nr:GIY-YIG nuclease family protein [Bacteroidota bacterium]